MLATRCPRLITPESAAKRPLLGIRPERRGGNARPRPCAAPPRDVPPDRSVPRSAPRAELGENLPPAPSTLGRIEKIFSSRASRKAALRRRGALVRCGDYGRIDCVRSGLLNAL